MVRKFGTDTGFCPRVFFVVVKRGGRVDLGMGLLAGTILAKLLDYISHLACFEGGCFLKHEMDAGDHGI